MPGGMDALYTLYVQGLPFQMHEGSLIEMFKLFGQLAQFYQVNAGYDHKNNAKRKGTAFVKFCSRDAMLNCYSYFRGGVEVPHGHEHGWVYAQKSSKELIQPGFPYRHRDGLWPGENNKYAKPVSKYCCTNFGEF